jgi:hypothetical protein
VNKSNFFHCFSTDQSEATIFFAKSTFFHASQREKKSFFHAGITFFHAGITFFHAGITFFHAAASSVKKSDSCVKKSSSREKVMKSRIWMFCGEWEHI